jgi:methionyl-tRNA formyltransferase
MRIVFMGTPDFATGILDAIVSDGKHIVSAVVTAVDKPAGRGMKLQASSVKLYAEKHALTVLQPEKLRDKSFLRTLQAIDADLFVVVAFRMLPEVVWRMPRLGTVNLHASLLPDYRGAAPIHWAIINGESISGVTTFFINEKIDEGEIILNKQVAILPHDNAVLLHDKLLLEGRILVLETLNRIAENRCKSYQQPLSFHDHKLAPKIHKEDCQIDWSDTGENIYNKVRGLSPYPSAFTTFINKENVRVQVKIFEVETVRENHHEEVGFSCSDDQKYLRISCADGYVFVKNLQIHGKKRMSVRDFLRGNKGFDGVKFL